MLQHTEAVVHCFHAMSIVKCDVWIQCPGRICCLGAGGLASAQGMQRDDMLVLLQLVADVYNINPAPHYAIFNGLLLFLFGLHLYW